jgi:hypothetical protein
MTVPAPTGWPPRPILRACWNEWTPRTCRTTDTTSAAARWRSPIDHTCLAPRCVPHVCVCARCGHPGLTP